MRVRRVRRVGFYLLVRLLDGFARALPAPVARGALRGLAAVAWATRRRDRERALHQLEIAFPERPERWRLRVARQALARLADNLVANVRDDVPVVLNDASRRRLEELAAEERPLLVVMAHYGAWELAGGILARHLPRFAALTADPHNHRVGAWLRRRREERGVEVFDRDRDRLSAARWLRRGGSLAVLVDHVHGATREALWFGRPVATVVGPARLARWAGARLLGVHLRGGPVSYELVVGPECDATEAADESELVVWCNACTEAWIREDPTQWTWWQDRFGAEGAK